MSYTEFGWRCADDTRMFACEWRPAGGGEVRGVVALVHGMGEHAGRYGHVAEVLTAEGYAVLAFDQRGHGRTEGKRGHAPSYEALLESVDLLLAEAESRYPGLPRFLYGHSMGGNVTLNYLLRRKPALSGAVVTSPWLKLAFQPPPLQVIIGRVVERVFPGYSNYRPLAAERLTSDPVMIGRLTEDPLGHGHITAGFFFGVHRAGQWALEHADELAVPLLLLHGDDDKVTSIEASRQFAGRAGGRCTFVEWPEFRHELHNETNRNDVFACILKWLEERLESGS